MQMLLGIFSSKGVQALQGNPAHSAGDLLSQRLNELEQEAERNDGVLQAASDQLAKVYKAHLRVAVAA